MKLAITFLHAYLPDLIGCVELPPIHRPEVIKDADVSGSFLHSIRHLTRQQTNSLKFCEPFPVL